MGSRTKGNTPVNEINILDFVTWWVLQRKDHEAVTSVNYLRNELI